MLTNKRLHSEGHHGHRADRQPGLDFWHGDISRLRNSTSERAVLLTRMPMYYYAMKCKIYIFLIQKWKTTETIRQAVVWIWHYRKGSEDWGSANPAGPVALLHNHRSLYSQTPAEYVCMPGMVLAAKKRHGQSPCLSGVSTYWEERQKANRWIHNMISRSDKCWEMKQRRWGYSGTVPLRRGHLRGEQSGDDEESVSIWGKGQPRSGKSQTKALGKHTWCA